MNAPEPDCTAPLKLTRPARKPARPTACDTIFARVNLKSDANFYAGLDDDEPVGVFVPTYVWRPLGQRVTVVIDTPASEEQLVVQTEVRWHRVPFDASDASPGLGLAFVRLSAQQRIAVAAFARVRPPLLYDCE